MGDCLADESIIQKIVDLAAGAPLYVLQKCRRERVLSPDFFTDKEPFTDRELEQFKEMAEKKVERCYIR